jgi:hypothetical protein
MFGRAAGAGCHRLTEEPFQSAGIDRLRESDRLASLMLSQKMTALTCITAQLPAKRVNTTGTQLVPHDICQL